ncbi:MAG: DNA polymerase III subunit gamma/tau [Candidatus Omnitrophica bacterium]|nr:DNA polymerase III subunit gamma/tau [Candidatus Omnitrophota bacterium]
MAYLPFARKYRPQTFEELIGQPHVTTTLTQALKAKRVAQAYLFAGPRGVGKTSAARILAKALNCEKGPTATPCDACASCTQIISGSSLDVIEIDGASNRGIEEIRTLRESVGYAAATGEFRLYIIDEVHMLTTEAFNALLKTLEEPPAHVKFIFATTAPNKVPATILSRCQRFDFRRVDVPTLVKQLSQVVKAEKIHVAEPAVYAIARAADGSVRDGEVLLDQAASFVKGAIEESDVIALLGAIEADALIEWVRAIIDRNAPGALSLLAKQLDQGKDAAQLLMALVRHLRNLLMLRVTDGAASKEELRSRLIDEPAERLSALERQAARLGPQELLLALQVLMGAYELVRRSPMAPMILELVIIKLSTREQWQSLEQITQRLEQLSAQTPHHMGAGQADSTEETGPTEKTRKAPTPGTTHQPAESMGAVPAVATIWPAFLERLGAKKISLAAYLAHAKPLALEAGTLTVGLPGFALHQEVVSEPETRRLIAALLSELLKTAVRVEYTTLSDLPSPAPADAPAASAGSAPGSPLVQDIVKLFNATVLDRPSVS